MDVSIRAPGRGASTRMNDRHGVRNVWASRFAWRVALASLPAWNGPTPGRRAASVLAPGVLTRSESCPFPAAWSRPQSSHDQGR